MLDETEVQRMVRKTWIRKWKRIRKYHDKFFLSTMKPLHVGWLRASGISAAVEDGLICFLIDPFNEIDPLTKPLNST